MTMHTHWMDHTQQNIQLVIHGRWKPDDLVAEVEQVRQMMSSVGHRVTVILNLVQSGPFPIDSARSIRSLVEMDHPNRGKIVILGTDVYLEGITDIIQRIFAGNIPDYVQITASPQEAG